MSNDGKTGLLCVLQKARDEHRAVAVYAEGDGFERYEVGFVEDASLKEVSLRCLTTRGEPDGLRAVRTDEIGRVDFDTLYLRKLETLFEYRASVFANEFPATPAQPGVVGQLVEAQRSGAVVHVVDANDYGPTGYVRHLGDESVEIERVGPHGEPDGHATLLMRNIAKVHVGRRQEQTVGFLHRYHSGLRRLIEG